MGKKVKEEKALPKKRKSSSSRKGLALWIFLIFFVSAWMFILGILVGRGTAPVQFDIEKLQNELAALKEDDVKEELERFKIDSNAADNKIEMNFYEELKVTKDEDSLNIETSEQKKEPLPENTVSESKKIGPSEEVLSVKAHQESKPETISKTDITNKNLTIQVASFKDPNVADKMVEELKKKGFPAYRSIGKVPGKGIWYRVRIGYFSTKSEAGSMLKMLKKDKLNAILVNR
ncbi:MAG: SPOR domain-containing protein [Desulfobacterales bacterium]